MSDGDRQDLTGFFYALVSGLPGTTKSMRSKAFSRRDLAEDHVRSLMDRFPDAKCNGYYKITAQVPNKSRDLAV